MTDKRSSKKTESDFMDLERDLRIVSDLINFTLRQTPS